MPTPPARATTSARTGGTDELEYHLSRYDGLRVGLLTACDGVDELPRHRGSALTLK